MAKQLRTSARDDVTQSTPVFRRMIATCAAGLQGVNTSYAVHDIFHCVPTLADGRDGLCAPSQGRPTGKTRVLLVTTTGNERDAQSKHAVGCQGEVRISSNQHVQRFSGIQLTGTCPLCGETTSEPLVCLRPCNGSPSCYPITSRARNLESLGPTNVFTVNS